MRYRDRRTRRYQRSYPRRTYSRARSFRAAIGTRNRRLSSGAPDLTPSFKQTRFGGKLYTGQWHHHTGWDTPWQFHHEPIGWQNNIAYIGNYRLNRSPYYRHRNYRRRRY